MMTAVQVVGLLIGMLFFSLLLVYGYILLTTKKMQWQERQYHIYLKKQEQAWHSYLLEGEAIAPKMIPKNNGMLRAIEEICSTYLRLVNDQEIQQRITHFAETYLTKYYRQQLTSRIWSTRVNALRYIGLFKMTSLVEESRKLLTQNISQEERFELLQLLALQNTEALLTILKEQNLPKNEYKRLLRLLPTKELVQVIEQSMHLPQVAQLILAEVAAERRDPLLLPYAKKLLKSEESELRIGGLKISNALQAMLPITTIVSFVTSDSYVERLFAAKNLSHNTAREALPQLKKLLSDENWYVRHEAAAVIVQHEDGAQLLQDVIATSSDRYAVDIAKQALQNGGELHG